MGDTLLDGFSPDEIEVVFAHEIGHHVHHHIHKLILAGVVSSAAGFWICDRILSAWAGIGPGGASYSALPVSSLPLLMLWLTCFGLLLEPFQNAISRHFERQSDRYALERTGLALGLSFRLSQAGAAEQRRSESPAARGISLSQPPADRRTPGDGRVPRLVVIGACPRTGISSGGRCQMGVGSRFRHDAGSHYGSFSGRNRLPPLSR